MQPSNHVVKNKPQKCSNPLQNTNKHHHRGQPHSVQAECNCQNKKISQKYVTVGVCEGWGEEDGGKGKVKGGAVRENLVASDGREWWWVMSEMLGGSCECKWLRERVQMAYGTGEK